MYVERVLSLNGGWSILTTEKESEWNEAQTVLSMLDEGQLLRLLKIDHDSEAPEGLSFIYYYLYLYYNDSLQNAAKWEYCLPAVNSLNISPRGLKMVKNGVSAALTGYDTLSGGDFISTLYLDTPFYYNSKLLDVNVILVPTKDAIDYMIEFGASLDDDAVLIPTEEYCRNQLSKFKSLNSKAPVVLAFFSPTAPNEIAVEEISTLKIEGYNIERTIEFAPEYYQAGVGLLSYFGEVLRQKDPNTTAKVRIEQDGTVVRLHIESASGEIETIEKELQKFALVISEQLPPESLFENRAHIMKLENKLEMTKMEVKHEQDLRQLTDGLNSQRINTLEQQVADLRSQLSSQLLLNGQVVQLTSQQTSSHERIVAALIDHSQGLFKDLLHEASGNQQLTEAVHSLQNSLLAGIDAVDAEDKLERALSTIKTKKPGFLSRIFTEFKGAAYKGAASSGYAWVLDWIYTH